MPRVWDTCMQSLGTPTYNFKHKHTSRITRVHCDSAVKFTVQVAMLDVHGVLRVRRPRLLGHNHERLAGMCERQLLVLTISGVHMSIVDETRFAVGVYVPPRTRTASLWDKRIGLFLAKLRRTVPNHSAFCTG